MVNGSVWKKITLQPQSDLSMSEKTLSQLKIVVGLNPEKLFITQFQSTMRFDFFQLKFIIPKSTVCLIFR